jgi:alkylhydroperoxidase family enzyme
MSTTLAEVLSSRRVEFDELHRRYHPVLALVEVLIGVVPNCDRYLEIWPPGFRTYNLVVPNFLNLPSSLLSAGAPKDVVGLAMYASSRAAGCAYCSAHTCSFALRRGSSPDAVTGQSRTPAEAAAVAVAEALSWMPHRYTPDLGRTLTQYFSAGEAEWIVMGVAMMGFLNKFMDALGVELESEAVGDVAGLIGPTGWHIGQHGWADQDLVRATSSGLPPKDSVGVMAKVVRQAPGALRLDRRWMSGVPGDPTQARRLVAERYGFDEPLLTSMSHSRPRRALAAMLRHNLDPAQSVLGLGTKALVAVVFANHAQNAQLLRRAESLAARHGVAPTVVAAAQTYHPDAIASGAFDDVTAIALATAHAISPSPASIDSRTVEAAGRLLTAAQIVELAVWVSVCQLIHRLSVYFDLDH